MYLFLFRFFPSFWPKRNFNASRLSIFHLYTLLYIFLSIGVYYYSHFSLPSTFLIPLFSSFYPVGLKWSPQLLVYYLYTLRSKRIKTDNEKWFKWCRQSTHKPPLIVYASEGMWWEPSIYWFFSRLPVLLFQLVCVSTWCKSVCISLPWEHYSQNMIPNASQLFPQGPILKRAIHFQDGGKNQVECECRLWRGGKSSFDYVWVSHHTDPCLLFSSGACHHSWNYSLNSI